MVIRLIQNIPNEVYKDLKISFNKQLSSTVDPLTLQSLRLKLRAHVTLMKVETPHTNNMGAFTLRGVKCMYSSNLQENSSFTVHTVGDFCVGITF